MNPEHHPSQPTETLHTVEVLINRAESGVPLRDAILSATAQVASFDPAVQFAIITSLAECAQRIKTWEEYRPGEFYNSSAGTACDVLEHGLNLSTITSNRQQLVRLHYLRMEALWTYERNLPIGARRLGGAFYDTACDIDAQRRRHARHIMQLTDTVGKHASFDSFYRMEAGYVLRHTEDIRVNPEYL